MAGKAIVDNAELLWYKNIFIKIKGNYAVISTEPSMSLRNLYENTHITPITELDFTIAYINATSLITKQVHEILTDFTRI